MFTFCKSIWKVKFSRQFFGKRNFNVLGIETSCDDTAAAVVNDSGTILGENHFSQGKMHFEIGGILPNLAENFHRNYIKNVVDDTMKQSGLTYKELDAIAVTTKPGLILCLDAGLEYAKDLCTIYQKPLIPIHHMQAHALTARMIEDIKFPFLVFLMSGGHCILAVAESVDKFYILGEASDQTPGQAFDKFSRRTRLKTIKKLRGLVGGAAIETAALEGNPDKFPFATSIYKYKDCNFSFGGIYSSASNYVKEQEKLLQLGPDAVLPDINDLCASFQWSLTRHLCQRLEVAINYLNVKNTLNEKCLVVSGGVASNNFIRKGLKIVCDHYNYRMLIPPAKLCTDNGVMIAWNGIEKLKENFPVVHPNNLASVTAVAKNPMGENISDDVRSVMKYNNFKYIKLQKILKAKDEDKEKKKDSELKQNSY